MSRCASIFEVALFFFFNKAASDQELFCRYAHPDSGGAALPVASLSLHSEAFKFQLIASSPPLALGAADSAWPLSAMTHIPGLFMTRGSLEIRCVRLFGQENSSWVNLVVKHFHTADTCFWRHLFLYGLCVHNMHVVERRDTRGLVASCCLENVRLLCLNFPLAKHQAELQFPHGSRACFLIIVVTDWKAMCRSLQEERQGAGVIAVAPG